jgi:parallel beta-helix repeat protein
MRALVSAEARGHRAILKEGIMKHVVGALAGACLFAPCTFATTPSGNTLYAANNGLDSPACGAISDPCRTITQAIANAVDGDTIVAKPGRYGELDNDGALGSMGEETGSALPNSLGAVYVNKRVKLISSAGAGATTINAGGAASAAVHIAADGAQVGDRNAGFTLIGGREYGLYTGGPTDIAIIGNIARNAPFAGFMLHSFGTLEARLNTATGQGAIGIWVTGFGGNFGTIANNLAFGNTTGIAVGGTGPHRVNGNEVSGNDTGMSINYGESRIAQNQITANGFGIMINGYSDDPEATGPVITRNNILGNRTNGVYTLPGPAGAQIKVRENNIFGNGGCGSGNQSTAVIDARRNFWGAATGPSFQDPADPDCSAPGAMLTTPFATTEFDVR